MDAVSEQTKPVAGFEPWADPQSPFELKSVTLYDGHPSEMASLMPDLQTEDKMEWNILPDPTRKVWIACSYQNTSIAYIRQLPDSVRACVVNFRENITIDGMPAIDKVECK